MQFSWDAGCVSGGTGRSSWVNLNMSVLWQAGERMIHCLNCVSSTLRDSHQKAVSNSQPSKLVQQGGNYAADSLATSGFRASRCLPTELKMECVLWDCYERIHILLDVIIIIFIYSFIADSLVEPVSKSFRSHLALLLKRLWNMCFASLREKAVEFKSVFFFFLRPITHSTIMWNETKGWRLILLHQRLCKSLLIYTFCCTTQAIITSKCSELFVSWREAGSFSARCRLRLRTDCSRSCCLETVVDT